VYAPADGTVVFTGTLAVRGNAIVLDHGWGVMTGYWHLSAIHVTTGDVVAQGQHIGDIGNSGLSTGPHLHWEMRVNGVPTSGLQWVREEFP
jgi:murein DD-endopeptidase MepM/ murein hydrolase activator NlpD